MKKGTVRQIIWRDSRMYLTQCGKDDDFKVAKICSIGYFVKEDKDSITIAGDVLDDGDVRRVITIPKENIV